MDWETEKRLAALIMEEATRLRQQADKEGVHVYLAKPTVRGRPNPQFLKATVRGIEQANRVAEVNDMWRRRVVELEHDETNKKERHMKNHRHVRDTRRVNEREEFTSLASSSHARSGSPSRSLPMENASDYILEHCADFSHGPTDHHVDDGLNEDEVEKFLHSRVKRGRGMVGSRMDETGPYLLPQSGRVPDVRVKEDWEDRVIRPVGCLPRELDGPEPQEMRKHKKKKHKAKDSEDYDEDLVRPHSKSSTKKKSKQKHRSSHKSFKRRRAEG